MSTKKILTKDDRIKREIRRLKKLFEDIPKDTLSRVMSLINNAAFMTITLEDLAGAIIRDGAVSEYQNGENQWGTKKSPEVEIYNTMIKNHASVIKQLTDLIPKPKTGGGGNEDEDEFNRFVNGREDA
jgi:hypothetical protein